MVIFGDDGNGNVTASTVSSIINVDNIETESTGTGSSVVRACDTNVSSTCIDN